MLKKFRNILLLFLQIIIFVYILILIFLYFYQRNLMYHPNENNYSDDQITVNIKKVKINTSDNIELLGWYHEKDLKKHKTVVFFHGNAGSLENRIHKLNHFQEMDVNFLIIAWRGFSGNNGSPTEKGLYEDGKSAISWLIDKGVKEENLVLALLNTYNMGKTEYYSLLNTMLMALGEFDDPEVKKAVIEIAHSKDYPIDIRKKAIGNLAAFNDPTVLNGLLPMLEIKENYIYYDNIINMVYSLGEEEKNAELVRRMAFKAHYMKREHE